MRTDRLEDLTDKYIGKESTKTRDEFDSKLRFDVLGEANNQARFPKSKTELTLTEKG